MGTLTKQEIINYLHQGKLLTNVRRLNNAEFDVQAASYDLCIGTAVSKGSKGGIFQRRIQKSYIPGAIKQATVTLQPGQMIYVIAYEEVDMPKDLCGTVFSRNSLALDGILALNTGHIDPGYTGPITIKLINLRSSDYTFTMGKAIFTITFHTLKDYQVDNSITYKSYTKDQILDKVFKATDVSLGNALYDLALLHDFVKKDEFGSSMRKWLLKSFWGLFITIFGGITALMAAIVSAKELLDILKSHGIFK